MPYIDESFRTHIEKGHAPLTAGHLNYALCDLLLRYVKVRNLSYQTINDVIGALEGAKAEFQRRVVAPYEDRKIAENGDLPWPSVE